jgi:hypothetical protein
VAGTSAARCSGTLNASATAGGGGGRSSIAAALLSGLVKKQTDKMSKCRDELLELLSSRLRPASAYTPHALAALLAGAEEVKSPFPC